MRLLLVEDDQILGDGISKWLRESDHAVDWLDNGETALHALLTQEYELIVLDINLPGQSGLDVLKNIRSEGNDVPVLLLTARDTVADRVKGLDMGADDYLIKPFDLDELSARIRALQRRRSGRSDPEIKYQDILMDLASHTVSKAGKSIDLSSREFVLLQFLLENTGKVLSKNKIESYLYAWHDEISSNTVEVHIHHIRKKLGNDLIRTIRGVGYTIDKKQ